MRAGAEECVVDDRLVAEVQHTWGRSGGLLCWHMLSRESTHVARPAQNFYGVRRGPELQTAAETNLVLAFAFEMLIAKSDTNGSAKVKAATKDSKEERAALFGQQKGRCVGSSAWNGGLAVTARPCSAFHLNYSLDLRVN